MIDPKNFAQFLAPHEIERIVQQLADQINEDYRGKTVVLVGVLKGSFVFLADLIRKLEVDHEVDFIRIKRIGKRMGTGGTISIVKDIQTDLSGKHVLVAEQIIDSGRGLAFVYERLKSSEAQSVEIVALLDKPTRRIADIPVKYIGRTIQDQFLVGYGLDLEEQSRDLPAIYKLKYPN